MKDNYQQSSQELLNKYHVKQEEGLSTEQVEKSRQEYGDNSFEKQKKESFLKKIIYHSLDVTTIILLVAAIISITINISQPDGHFLEGAIIILIVILNAFLGANQERNAEKSLESLQALTKQTSTVIRNGTKQIVESSELVPGDIIELETGDVVSADARLLESNELSIDESPLTGESLSSEKNSQTTFKEDVSLGDRENMVYSGCLVNTGRGLAIVTETGMHTEMGKIASLLSSETNEKTPLQNRLNVLGKKISYLALAAAFVVFIIGLLQGEPMLEMFMTAVSLAVAAIPETLMVIVTVTLSVSVQKMVKRHAIIRKIPAVETLGSASIICSDKTGTLTQNKMTAKEVWTDGFNIIDVENSMTDGAMNVIKMASLCSNATIQETEDGVEEIIGDATEQAIVKVLDDNDIKKEEYDIEKPRIVEIPFNSTKKMMTTVHKNGDHYVSITKGSFDHIVPLCKDGDFKQAATINRRFGKKGMRVITVAFKYYDELPDVLDEAELEKDLTLLGLIGIIDPPRPESKAAIERAKKAGIRTIMITGDHIVTASAIAKELGILKSDTEALSGEDLSMLTDEELKEAVVNYNVYARVSPEDKIRIVKAWQARGEVVAMTGDGVNDAPALNASDVGCAMGISGTEVAKGASDMILTDDNFATIIDAVEEGRTAYANIRKAINFLLTANISEVFILTLAILFGWGAPVMAIHLLIINVVADGLPGFTFAVEKPEEGFMSQKPISKNQSIFADGLGKWIGWNGVMFTMISLFGYYLGRFVNLSSQIGASHDVAQTMIFLIIGYSSVIHAFNCRSSQSIFSIGFTSNKKMFQMILLSLSILTVLTLVPFLRDALFLVPLAPIHWIIVIVLSVLPLFVTELVKLHYRRDDE
ncbi:cation-translocating P-type ATPase [Vagococcus bubulae]|uniref:P-type Ca(2+) transporter n=1 Tax=Vagococcus bubulae TaxID=1977868 RepID=A0A429ZA14_9ENTE|nr:cation-translocating P-type ATPase [Vagococcus bubulae]RST90532.1 magnesium-transporting ATPase [Vagococcus bubulae]